MKDIDLAVPAKPGLGTTVALFATCVNDTMYPGTPRAVVTLLERLGCDVVFPRTQTCCGQMFTNTGYYPEALPSVRAYVEAFEDFDYIVGPSGSCVGSVRDQHPMLAEYAQDKALADKVAKTTANTLDLTEFLVDVLGVTDVGAYFPHRVTYHPTCHSLRITQVGDRPYRLLQAVQGLSLVELPDERQCCGFGGTFSMKNADTSVAMGADKVAAAMSTHAEYLVAGDNSCLMHLAGLAKRMRTGIRSIHLAEILASTVDQPYQEVIA